MQEDFTKGKRHEIPSKRHPHWAILTVDDLDKTSWKNNQMIIQLRAQFQATKKPGAKETNQKAADFSI